MGNWADARWANIKEWNRKRKKGLKNPVTLWSVSFLLTIALTALPAMILDSIRFQNPSILLSGRDWTEMIVNNLYPMIITQSVVTALQNHSISAAPKERRKTSHYVVRDTWTSWLFISLIFYVLLYLALAYVSPPWQNPAFCILSGLMMAVGLGSVLQISREQERVQEAMKRDTLQDEHDKKRDRARRLDRAQRDVGDGGLPPPLPDPVPPDGKAEEKASRSKDDAPV